MWEVKLFWDFPKSAISKRVPILHVSQMENHQVGENSYVLYHLGEVRPIIDLKFFNLVRPLELGAIFNDSFQRHSHFRLQCRWNSILKRLLGLYLLIENSKSNILKVGYCWNLFIKYHLLCNNVDQISIFCIILLMFPQDFILNFFGKRGLRFFSKDWKFSLIIFGHNGINLAWLKLLECIDEEDWLEDLLFDLFDKLTIDFVGTLLEVNITEESILFLLLIRIIDILSVLIFFNAWNGSLKLINWFVVVLLVLINILPFEKILRGVVRLLSVRIGLRQFLVAFFSLFLSFGEVT